MKNYSEYLKKNRKAQGIVLPVAKKVKIYPNDPCPCGSGKKYKKCCGRTQAINNGCPKAFLDIQDYNIEYRII